MPGGRGAADLWIRTAIRNRAIAALRLALATSFRLTLAPFPFAPPALSPATLATTSNRLHRLDS